MDTTSEPRIFSRLLQIKPESLSFKFPVTKLLSKKLKNVLVTNKLSKEKDFGLLIGDQLSRRSVYIHLPRYNAEFIEDREIWQSIIWNFQGQIPTVEEPDFLSNWNYLYERSLGCVGILKNWLNNALADALAEEANIITLSHLERRALSVGQCRNIFKAIKEGEKRATEIEGEVEKLRIELGLGGKPVFRQKISKELQQSQEQSSQTIAK